MIHSAAHGFWSPPWPLPFVAVDLGKAIRDRAVALQKTLARTGTEVKWVEPEHLPEGARHKFRRAASLGRHGNPRHHRPH